MVGSGEMPEWLKGTVLKTVVQETVPRVRIPVSPFYTKIYILNFIDMKQKKDIGVGGAVSYRPKDRYEGYPKDLPYWQRRIFEIIPGLVLWIFLLLPVIFALLRWEEAFVIYVIFVVAYWFFRAIKFIIGIYLGVRRMNRSVDIDWVKRIEDLKDPRAKDLRYIYLCPVYGEDYALLDSSFADWAKNDIGAEKIDVVLAMEEKKSELQIENFKKLEKKYGKLFGSMQYYVHPFGIPGEIVGVKGGNINYSARKYVKKLEEEGKNLNDYLLITCDSDLRPHSKYLSAVTYEYLTVENPMETFFTSAIHTFNNNIWSVPPLIRVFSNTTTLAVLYTWVFERSVKSPFTKEEYYTRDTFSSYIVNLQTLKDMEYWDPEIPNDDTAFYWNSMVRSKGNFKGREVYLPTYNDAIENKDFKSTHEAFYKQQYRWGWGKIPFPITLSVIFRRGNGISLFRKTHMFKSIVEQMWMFSIVLLLSFGVITISLLDPEFKYTAYSYNLPKLISYVLTIAMVTNIATVILRRRITPIPKGWSWWRNVLDMLETYLISINMLTFNFVPHVQAITEMMLGKGKFKRNFYITEKIRSDSLPDSG